MSMTQPPSDPGAVAEPRARAQRAATARPVPPLSQSPGPEAMPPAGTRAASRGRLAAHEAAGEYLFEIGALRYRLRIGPPEGRSPLLRIETSAGQGEWRLVCEGAGMLLRDGAGSVLHPSQTAGRLQVREVRPSARGRTLTLKYEEELEGSALRRAIQVRLVGQSLVLQLTADAAAPVQNEVRRASRRRRRTAPGTAEEASTPTLASSRADGAPTPGPGYCGFTFGTIGDPGAREVLIPYTIDPVYLLTSGWFAAAYVDRLVSRASACPHGSVFYRADSSGVVGPISETLYLTVSQDPLEVLPLLEATPSPSREELARQVVLDVWSEAPFATDAETFERLWRYGMKDLLVHYHTWQQFGFGRRLPTHYPANPERGTNEEFRQLVQTARRRGWRVALREDYSAISPESRYWDERVVARTGDGRPRPASLGGLAIAADRMLAFARLESTKIERNYAPGAASAGRGAAYNPEDQLHQLDPGTAGSGSLCLAEAIRHCRSLFAYLKELHGGPLIGEGGEGPGRFDTFYAGTVDGFERPLDGRASGPVIPDYELRRVQPLMANHGVGYYGRFFNEIHGQAPINPAQVDWDLYRATEIAFGHAGFLSTAQVPGPSLGPWTPMGSMRQAFSEYFLMRAVQERTMIRPVRRVEYHQAGQFLELAGALRAGLDLAQAQLRVEFDRGLTVYVNRHARQPWAVPWSGTSYTLPPTGWLVADGSELLAYSALIAGSRADVVRSPDYTFLNVRSDVARRIEGITTDGAAALVRGAVPGRLDLFVCGCKTLAQGEEILKLSERADFSLIHLSEREMELCVLDSDSDGSVSVTIPTYGAEWEQSRLMLEEREAGEWRRASNQIQHTRRGLQVVRMRPEVVYRLTLPAD
jgi:hypothetical protein